MEIFSASETPTAAAAPSPARSPLPVRGESKKPAGRMKHVYLPAALRRAAACMRTAASTRLAIAAAACAAAASTSAARICETLVHAARRRAAACMCVAAELLAAFASSATLAASARASSSAAPASSGSAKRALRLGGEARPAAMVDRTRAPLGASGVAAWAASAACFPAGGERMPSNDEGERTLSADADGRLGGVAGSPQLLLLPSSSGLRRAASAARMSSAVAGLTSHSQKPGSPALARTSASRPVMSTTSTSSRNLIFLAMSFSFTRASSRKNTSRP